MIESWDGQTRIIRHGIFFSNPIQFKCECGCVYETTDISVNIYDNHSGPMGSKVASCWAECPECCSKNNTDKYLTVEEERHD